MKQLLFMVVFIYLLTGCAENKTSIPVDSDNASLGQRLTFPEGYHLVAVEAYAYQGTGPYVVYICQSDDDPRDYRVCSPKSS